MKILVPFSGGKDSQACLIWAVRKFGTSIIPVFCDTGYESSITYKHLKYVCEQLNVNLVTIKSKEYTGMKDLAQKRSRFPSRMTQFCTQKLKVEPMIDYVLELNESVIIIEGKRREESEARRNLERNCEYFKYYFTPYGHDKKGNPKTFSYRKKDVAEFVKSRAHDIIRPFVTATVNEVLDYSKEAGILVNPLYYMGMSRVGCFPCINANLPEIYQIVTQFPERIDMVEAWENELDSTFFNPKIIPKRYATKEVITKDGRRMKVPTIRDVAKYVLATRNQMNFVKIAEQENPSCISHYAYCE